MTSIADWSSITDTNLVGAKLDSEFLEADAPAVTIDYHGRSTETSTLLKAYHNLLKTKTSQTIIIHGTSGSGKTTLVDVLRDSVCNRTPGYFVAGKYFQNSGGMQEAHSAIAAAFSDLCDLVAQSDDFDEDRQEQIRNSLGSDAAQLLFNSISNFSPFISDQHAVNAASTEIDVSAKSKFKMACKAFLRAMASEDHPIVIFLDDIQWADEGSKQIIEMLLQDSELRNVMIVLAYRDEEAEEVKNVIRNARSPIYIQLSNLDEAAVMEMVSNTAGSSSENVAQLSQLVMKRTIGHPFYIKVLMEAIQREEMYTIDSTTKSRIYKLDEIQARIMASESLADLLTSKIALLQPIIVDTLKVASLLGYHFDEAMLVAVASAAKEDRSPPIAAVAQTTSILRFSLESVLVPLREAAKQGFVEETSEGYQFTHDKLQASFQSMISQEEQNWLHLLIGQAFLASSARKNKMYNAAVHLNSAPAFLHNHEQRAVLARINSEAAAYCKGKSAFLQAVTMLRNGLNLIGSDERWLEQNRKLTFEMTESLAIMELIVGDFDSCKQTTHDALCHCTTVEMKIKFLLIEVEVTMAGSEVQASLSTSFRALAILGVTMPSTVKWRDVAAKLLKVRYMLRKKTDADILNLPVADDFLVTTSIKLLAHVCCQSLVQDDVLAFIYAGLLGTELTLNTGSISPYSPGAFVIYGIAESGNAERAHRYNRLSLAMLDCTPCKEAECFTLCFTTSHLRSNIPMRQLLEPYCRASDSGLLRGDLLHAAYVSAQVIQVNNYLGTHLTEMEYLIRERYETISDLSQENLLLSFQPALQFVLNMQNDAHSWGGMSVLSGEVMQEKTYFGKANMCLTLVGLLVKGEIAALFDQFELAESIYDKVKPMECHGTIVAINY